MFILQIIDGQVAIRLNGTEYTTPRYPLVDDGRWHHVDVLLLETVLNITVDYLHRTVMLVTMSAKKQSCYSRSK